MRIIRNSVLFFLLVFLFGISFYLMPFILIRLKKLDFPLTVLFSIAKKNTRSANSEEEKVLQLYTYVCKKIKKPNYKQVYDTTIFGFNGQHLYSGFGFCDEQCNTLLSLANTLNIKGRLIFLLGNDTISHHSVCEIKVANHYGMFDPFYQITQKNNEGKIASVREIISTKNLVDNLPKPKGTSRNKYKNLFDKKHPFKIAKYNYIIQLTNEKRIHAVYKLWYTVFGESQRKLLFNYYYQVHHLKKQDQNSINRLFF